MEIERVAARWAVPRRAAVHAPRGRHPALRDLRRPRELAEGDEIVLERIELEVA